MNYLKRRTFLAYAGTLLASLPLAQVSLGSVRKKRKLSFVLLGDLHFDKLSHHDFNYIKEKYAKDLVQIENYSKITKEKLPQLFSTIKKQAANISSQFYLQLGDFLEGLCGSEELATLQTKEFIALVKDQIPGEPFIVIKGNHDITGEGAKEAFRKVVHPWQSKEQDQEITSANSTFIRNNIRFVLFDCYTENESLIWFKKVMEDHKEDALFFCVHEPVVPYNARANWMVFDKADQKAQRTELLELLGKHNAIVLTGHLHKTSLVVRKTKVGNFVQLGIGSVIPTGTAEVKDHIGGLNAYQPDLVNLEPNFSPDTLALRKSILEDEKPFIKHFDYADFCGYATVEISQNNQVSLSVFKGTNTSPWTAVNLSKLLKS